MSLKRLLPVLLICAGSWSCVAAWENDDPAMLASVCERQQVQVWRRGRALRLHAIRLTADSISGVPFFNDPGCDTCRITVPRAAVDSVRYATAGAPEGRAIGVGVVLLLFIVVFPYLGSWGGT